MREGRVARLSDAGSRCEFKTYSGDGNYCDGFPQECELYGPASDQNKYPIENRA